MEVVLFRARTRPNVDREAYEQAFNEMLTLAAAVPGFVGIEGWANEDGDELAVVLFETDEAITAWYDHPDHRAMQQRGRDEFFSQYDISVATVRRRRSWTDET